MFERIITKQQFDTIFAGRHNSENCKRGIEALTYENFITAAGYYPEFGTESPDHDLNVREVAAFLGQISQETTGWWRGQQYNWGLCFIEEVSCVGEPSPCLYSYRQAGGDFPPVPGQSYHGRGAIQISWNYNYGQLSEVLYGDKNTLLNNPDLLAQDGVLAFRASLWFWMTPQPPKPSAHDVMIQVLTECTEQGHRNGFGLTTNIINGGLECGAGSAYLHQEGQKVYNRIQYFKVICEILGCSIGDHLRCDDQIPFNGGVNCRQVPKDGSVTDPDPKPNPNPSSSPASPEPVPTSSDAPPELPSSGCECHGLPTVDRSFDTWCMGGANPSLNYFPLCDNYPTFCQLRCASDAGEQPHPTTTTTTTATFLVTTTPTTESPAPNPGVDPIQPGQCVCRGHDPAYNTWCMGNAVPELNRFPLCDAYPNFCVKV
eukprot:Pgem_evm1s18761